MSITKYEFEEGVKKLIETVAPSGCVVEKISYSEPELELGMSRYVYIRLRLPKEVCPVNSVWEATKELESLWEYLDLKEKFYEVDSTIGVYPFGSSQQRRAYDKFGGTPRFTLKMHPFDVWECFRNIDQDKLLTLLLTKMTRREFEETIKEAFKAFDPLNEWTIESITYWDHFGASYNSPWTNSDMNINVKGPEVKDIKELNQADVEVLERLKQSFSQTGMDYQIRPIIDLHAFGFPGILDQPFCGRWWAMVNVNPCDMFYHYREKIKECESKNA